MIIAQCQECQKEFEYELKPGFPRKYCPECSAKKRQEYLDKQPVPVQKIPVVSPGEIKPVIPNGQLSMYVSYAKDVFCSLRAGGYGRIRNHPEIMADTTTEQLMKEAIELVKQAQEAFS